MMMMASRILLLECIIFIDEVLPGYANNNSTGDIAADQYHHYKVSIKMLHDHHFAFTVTTN
jgi:hypothetical protein